MYPPETHARFIELRAKGCSQRKAAEELGIHRSTALEWDRQDRSEIENLRHYEMEALQELLLPSHAEELTFLSEELNYINAMLKRNDYNVGSRTEQVWRRQMAILQRIDKLRLKYQPSPAPQPPTTQKPQ
jgi:transposase